MATIAVLPTSTLVGTAAKTLPRPAQATKFYPPALRKYVFTISITGWGIAVAIGLMVLSLHESRPGSPANVTSITLPLTKTPDIFTGPALFMFIHPKCPCSAASVEELARLMTQCRGRVRAEVLVYQPNDQPDSWSQTGLLDTIRSIPGVTVRLDRDADLAKRLGVMTSGQVLYFDRFGNLAFSGGITSSRGHAGDNDGVDAIVANLQNVKEPSAPLIRTPVFGCGIYACTATERPQ